MKVPKTSSKTEIKVTLNIKPVKLAGVPGFYLEAGHWRLAGPAGITIPVRDTRGRIVGLLVRCDNADQLEAAITVAQLPGSERC